MPDQPTFKFVFDCIVVGSGHAGSCAAISAVQSGCKRVLIVEKAPEEWAGGNGYFTAGAHRTVHGGLADLLPIVTNVSPELAATIDLGPYTTVDFTKDIMRLCDGKPAPDLVQALVENSRSAVEWLARDVGVRFILSFHRQAYKIDGRQKFWGGLVLSVADEGGKGLIADHQRALKKANIEIWYETPAVRLVTEGDPISGLIVRRKGEEVALGSPTVILACGGYEANTTLRAEYMGVEWNHAHVRGTPYNTGDGISLGRSIGAKLTGDFSNRGCHSTCWDAHSPMDRGDRVLSNQFTKSGYPLGLMLNSVGSRFVDEGADFRNYTYAAFGHAILNQPNGIAFQIFDAQIVNWLRREEYGDDVTEKIFAEDLESLAQKLVPQGLEDPTSFLKSIRDYNEAVAAHTKAFPGKVWDPSIKDGISTSAPSLASPLNPPKSNWALAVNVPPFMAVKVACGITFTFGGLAINPDTAAVLSQKTNEPIPGLFCTGELVGGLFYGNYPGGSGLTAGAVFGRKAGQAAARLVAAR